MRIWLWLCIHTSAKISNTPRIWPEDLEQGLNLDLVSLTILFESQLCLLAVLIGSMGRAFTGYNQSLNISSTPFGTHTLGTWQSREKLCEGRRKGGAHALIGSTISPRDCIFYFPKWGGITYICLPSSLLRRLYCLTDWFMKSKEGRMVTTNWLFGNCFLNPWLYSKIDGLILLASLLPLWFP